MYDCKIKRKIQKEFVIESAEPLVDGLFLADGYNTFSVVARRDSKRRLCLFDGAFDILEISDRSALRRYLVDIPTSPCLVKTDIGTAVVFGELFAVLYGFFFSFLDKESGNELFELYAKNDESVVILDEERLSTHFTGRPKRLVSDLVKIVENFKYITKDTYTYAVKPDMLIDEIYNRLQKVVEISGCDATFLINDAEVINDEVDQRLLFSFLLSALMLCRRIGSSREARVEFVSLSDVETVKVSFLTISDPSLLELPELEVFLGIADRRNMFFDCFFTENSVEAVFSPIKVDLSMYGFKSEQKFEWNVKMSLADRLKMRRNQKNI